MRTAVRSALAAAVLAMAVLTVVTPAVAAPGAASDPAPVRDEHTYSIPVGAVTDLGDLTKLGNLGSDLAGFLGH